MGGVWPLPRICEVEDLYCINVELLLVFMISILCYIYLFIYILTYLFIYFVVLGIKSRGVICIREFLYFHSLQINTSQPPAV